ncbi:hypothetical protein BAZSYMA_ACONTIG00185_1 [Bathymodiolus azoricus thioautotrophic gill symbiont]|uniref:Uncharacterized protein n=1 Tax=Bathymodiolus azoricus thioautotrophic gill symbiont TaxID=235205 RepID=A0A1H6LDP7_9GAMM|nr:hypothetical protein BAZSYMA_ACONTIG00185_1 [Bathymodiolus azoricus thioautotrophic gill symbiont]
MPGQINKGDAVLVFIVINQAVKQFGIKPPAMKQHQINPNTLRVTV